MNLYKNIKARVRDQTFDRISAKLSRTHRIKLREILQSQKGFTLVEMITVVAIVGITSTIAWSYLTLSDEKRVCKDIYSTMQLVRLRSVATQNNGYVDFDMDGGNVSDNVYTAYVDADWQNSNFGETSNSSSVNEFDFSQAYLPDTSATSPGVDLDKKESSFGGGRSSGAGVVFGLPTPTNPAAGIYPATWITAFPSDGVDFDGQDRVMFTSTGVVSNAGAVYVRDSDYDSDPNKTRMCAVTVNYSGIVKLWKWDGTAWK